MTQTMAEEIGQILKEAFSPNRLNIINDSASHAGHTGDDGSGESHFTIEIEAPAFSDMTRLARQRAVIACLLYTSPSPRDQRGSRMPSSA